MSHWTPPVFVCAFAFKSPELKAALVGQVARTLVIMGVDEVVVYEDCGACIEPARLLSAAVPMFPRNQSRTSSLLSRAPLNVRSSIRRMN